MASGLRLVLYDDTCREDLWWRVGLTHSWVAGVKLYRMRGAIDGALGITSWRQGLEWLAQQTQPIEEIQYWGHGKWGCALVEREVLSVDSLSVGHDHFDALDAIRDGLIGSDARWWFRTCETLGAQTGHDFARAWSEFFDCAVAGHTYVIGPWQSGLRVLQPGQRPDWSAEEGLIEGSADDPIKAQMSHPRFDRTITCLHTKIPKKWM